MESQRKPESAEEIQSFAERILAEPEYRKMVVAVLCAIGRREKPVIVGEELLKRLIGPPLQAKAIVTLFRTVQGAEYPKFCSDLFETAKILTALGALEEGMRLFTDVGLFCFGGEDLNDREREEIVAFLEAGRKLVKIPRWIRGTIEHYLHGKQLQPSKNVYRIWRQNIIKKIRNRDQGKYRTHFSAIRYALMAALATAFILDVLEAPDEDPDTSPDSAADTSPAPLPNLPATSSAPKEAHQIYQAGPPSYAKTICGLSGERKTFGFLERDRGVRVTCGMAENEGPSLEIAERSTERTANCIDLDLDDIPDACGAVEKEEEELRMVSPPPEDLSRWFGKTLREAAKRISH